jgi:hypothetical protein
MSTSLPLEREVRGRHPTTRARKPAATGANGRLMIARPRTCAVGSGHQPQPLELPRPPVELVPTESLARSAAGRRSMAAPAPPRCARCRPAMSSSSWRAATATAPRPSWPRSALARGRTPRPGRHSRPCSRRPGANGDGDHESWSRLFLRCRFALPGRYVEARAGPPQQRSPADRTAGARDTGSARGKVVHPGVVLHRARALACPLMHRWSRSSPRPTTAATSSATRSRACARRRAPTGSSSSSATRAPTTPPTWSPPSRIRESAS